MINNDTVLVCESSPIEIKNDEIKDRFSMLVNMWRHQAHCINRRLSSACVISIDEIINNKNIPQKFKSGEYFNQKLIPRSKIYSQEIYQFSKFISPLVCSFETINLDENLKSSHVEIPYLIKINCVNENNNENDKSTYKLQIIVSKDTLLSKCEWIKSHAFPRLVKWFKNFSIESENFCNESLINTESYANRYRDIKENIGKVIVQEWTEKTDPLKFVYEDCGISAYLCELWKSLNKIPQYFVDIGCGNGLLSYILTKEGYKGIGLDMRERKIWTKFKDNGCILIEKTLIPSSDNVSSIGIPRECDFIIGNHSDELTPWIPIMASRLECNFFLLPCCPFDFYGKFIHVPNELVKRNDKLFGAQGTSIYNNYLSYLKCLCEKLGYNVKIDRLRIPSTKRIALICTIPEEGLNTNLNCIIKSILETSKNNKNNIFIPRDKIEAVRNCSQIDINIRNTIIERIFNKLLSVNKEALYFSKWHTGGSLTILEVFKMLKDDEKILMKKQNGGFQTFLKNQYQIFKIHSGKVSIKNWAQEIKHVKIKKEFIHKSECWFHRYHPDGCPLPSEKCLFLH
ncbi:Probable tRNA (uracil-O(2)-)-methyltransferase [Strongyloides ratti]|uniref:tRNA (uracil-O(2)-)-methyltransferase n=1 Tax=Strongyloides ratti TaxID=34506 RepID=A0A090L4N2_STRRB|nr:Probable tRNA (uracil-O(2)-)-methyltransferase [Strongyloides ratti]CEF64736.1 Probable tRNA (uracil-O(2)-)-methyltransferase [Strongyloides ratti]